MDDSIFPQRDNLQPNKVRQRFGPRQVRTPRSIWPGKKVYLHSPDGRRLVTITKLNFDIDYGLWVIVDDHGQTYRIYLNDYNVVSYSSGSWNKTNWMEHA